MLTIFLIFLTGFTGTIFLKVFKKRKLFFLASFLNQQRYQLSRVLVAVGIVTFVFFMVAHPGATYIGAVNGLKAWWNIVFPSLLPFFIASELLINLGVVHFMGVLLEPVMRPLFNVPGTGSFVMAIGYTSGYPVGAMITARLRLQRLCTRIEGERLLVFTNNSSPLFMLVAVAAGMFHNPSLGPLIVFSHYLANLTLGFCLRYYGRKDPETIALPKPSRGNIIINAWREMNRVQRQENRPLGKIVSEAVSSAVNNLLSIGGFIIFFSVIIKLLTYTGWISFFARAMGVFLLPLGFEPAVLPAIASGLFEVTIGTKMVSETIAPLSQQLMAVAMILAWSGFSIHAQAASMIAKTDLRLAPYVFGRLAHALLAAFYTYLLFGPLNVLIKSFVQPVTTPFNCLERSLSLWLNLPLCGYISASFLIALFILFLTLLFLSYLLHLCLRAKIN
jgi:sporulation integral membrane protein YlbJ